jgi:hypothetical protein
MPDREATGDVPSATMPTSASVDLKTLVRIIGFLLLGGLGALALLFPLAGVLAYWAAFLVPLLLAWLLYGAILAVTRPARPTGVYLFANLGVLVGTLFMLVATWILLVTVGQPNTTVTAPLYLAIVLVGLAVGFIVGVRR